MISKMTFSNTECTEKITVTSSTTFKRKRFEANLRKDDIEKSMMR
jgi:hypothetical protein